MFTGNICIFIGVFNCVFRDVCRRVFKGMCICGFTGAFINVFRHVFRGAFRGACISVLIYGVFIRVVVCIFVNIFWCI